MREDEWVFKECAGVNKGVQPYLGIQESESVKVAIYVMMEQMAGMMDIEEAVERRNTERKGTKFLATIEATIEAVDSSLCR